MYVCLCVYAVGVELCEVCIHVCVCVYKSMCFETLLAAQVSSCVGTATMCSRI